MEHIYLVTYDICDDKRWRKVFKAMNGFGEWLQLSVFQCRLDRSQFLKMADALSERIDPREDHVLIVDVGPADSVNPKVTSLGRRFQPVKREAVIV
jgi:CRISPR-associated protein Cas2